VTATPPDSGGSSGGCDMSSRSGQGGLGLAFGTLALAAAKRRRTKGASRGGEPR
jgi:hypothetical protein